MIPNSQLAAMRDRQNLSVPYTGGGDSVADAWMFAADKDRDQLLAEVAELRSLIADRMPCDGCFDEPEEYCPMHGRTYVDILEQLEVANIQLNGVRRALEPPPVEPPTEVDPF